MIYDFDTPIDRSGTDSYKWDVKAGELPMWVADMDFAVLPQITQAIQERAAHPIYGYNTLPDAWYDSYIGWWERMHGFRMERDWLLFSTGVVPSLSSLVRRMTRPGENVLIQTPVYNIFFNSIRNQGRFVPESPLTEEMGVYRMNFADLEEKMAHPQTTLMILCNPQNPVGCIWDRETLAKVAELAQRHGVLVISDEIHCDITDPEVAYVPYQSVSDSARENSIACIAPTKAFNMAGLQTSALSVPNARIRAQVHRGINNDEIAEPNSFAVAATVAAFTHGAEWNRQMRRYVKENKETAVHYLHACCPQVHPIAQSATYLMWLDCGAVCPDSVLLRDFIRERTGLYLSEGLEYGTPGRRYLRWNVACPRSYLMDGLDRFARGIAAFIDR